MQTFLLMYAEAMNEQNKMSEDVWNATIRPIRVRAGFTDAQALNYPSGLSNKEMQKVGCVLSVVQNWL